MIRLSISCATASVRPTTIPITSRRSHISMPPTSTAAGGFLKGAGPHSAPMPPMRLALWLLFVGAFAALNLYGRSEGQRPDDDIVYQYGFAIGSIAGYAVLLSLVLALTVGLPRREVLALRRPDSWGRARAVAGGRRGRAEPDSGGLGQQPRRRLRTQLPRGGGGRADDGGAPLPGPRPLAPDRTRRRPGRCG